MSSMNHFKSGFVAVVGRPNVGKSTFVNNVLGQKIAIVSPKAQTTRNRIHGIYTTDTEQIIFIDTPGIHKPHHLLGEYMNKESFCTFIDCDLILLIIDGTQDFGSGDEFVLNELKKVKTPVYLVVNKIDLVKDESKLLANINVFQKAYDFCEIFYISAFLGSNTDLLLKSIIKRLENGPMYYPKDQISAQPETFIICELIREKVLQLTKEEVPHSVAVVLESMKSNDTNPNLVDINAVIYCERPSQKKIIIGKGGQMIKEIGTLARKEILMLLGTKIYLELWVKVENDWRDKSGQLRKLGYFTEQR